MTAVNPSKVPFICPPKSALRLGQVASQPRAGPYDFRSRDRNGGGTAMPSQNRCEEVVLGRPQSTFAHPSTVRPPQYLSFFQFPLNFRCPHRCRLLNKVCPFGHLLFIQMFLFLACHLALPIHIVRLFMWQTLVEIEKSTCFSCPERSSAVKRRYKQWQRWGTLLSRMAQREAGWKGLRTGVLKLTVQSRLPLNLGFSSADSQYHKITGINHWIWLFQHFEYGKSRDKQMAKKCFNTAKIEMQKCWNYWHSTDLFNSCQYERNVTNNGNKNGVELSVWRKGGKGGLVLWNGWTKWAMFALIKSSWIILQDFCLHRRLGGASTLLNWVLQWWLFLLYI